MDYRNPRDVLRRCRELQAETDRLLAEHRRRFAFSQPRPRWLSIDALPIAAKLKTLLRSQAGRGAVGQILANGNVLVRRKSARWFE